MTARSMPKEVIYSEEEKMKRAKNQLLVAGVICVAVVVFVLWLIHLPRMFAYHRSIYPGVRASFEKHRIDPGEKWKEFTDQLEQ